jgi:NitT/TauT family transport system substrate-binding protein
LKEYGIADSGDAVKLGIGAMTPERWKTFFDTMVAEGVYPADLDHTKAYTLAFVNKAHAAEMRK